MKFTVDIHPFRCGILFCVGMTDKEFELAVRSLNKGDELWGHITKEVSTEVGPMHAKTLCLPGGEGIIRMHSFKSVYDHGRLIHEIMHAVLHCLRNKDTPINEDTEELLCYSVQTIYEQAVEALNGKKK